MVLHYVCQRLCREDDAPFAYATAQEEYEIMLNGDQLVDSTSGVMNQDDQVSQMDLTDDLLHMVFYSFCVFCWYKFTCQLISKFILLGLFFLGPN